MAWYFFEQNQASIRLFVIPHLLRNPDETLITKHGACPEQSLPSEALCEGGSEVEGNNDERSLS
jgi:hypothetical protein